MITVSVKFSVTTHYVGWRGLHVAEGGRRPDPLGSPGVIPPFKPTVALTMSKDIQYMSYDLMAHFSPAVAADRGKWRVMHGTDVAMNNGTGFGSGAPLRDYVNQMDLEAPGFPRYDKMQRTFEGSLITGTLTDGLIWCTPGIDAIDARNFTYVPGTQQAAATLAKIIDKRWYSYAVAEAEDSVFKIRGHWGEGFVTFPFILDRPVAFNASFFTAWDETYPPDPLKIYIE
jgi:hypothetical protein